MERKRKLPARSTRVDSARRKRISTPSESTSQASPSPVPVVEELLPKSISAGQPLPTLDKPQPENLPSKSYQSISESGVLVESLQRSKQKWLSEGIFEKYWTKPTKKKGSVEPVNNPDKSTMTKLGSCTITVEPHCFEAQMFAIKEPTAKNAQQPFIQQPIYRPIIQYGPPNGEMPPPPIPAASPAPPAQQKPYPPPQSPQQQNLQPQDTPMGNSTNGSNYQASPVQHANHVANGSPHSSANTQGAAPHTNSPAPAPAAPSKSTDPVIQMLAERAATDPELKALMRIVANGEASQEELKRFQTHIDDLTRLQKSRQAAAAQAHPQPQSHPPQHLQNGHMDGQPSNMHRQSPAPMARAVPPPPKPQSHFQPLPQALRSKGPVPSKPDISGVVFEFAGGSGDRFLFPKFSILEYLPGGQVIASFLIVRKGSSSDSPRYDPKMDYYQPITIRLIAGGRQLDALQKVVAPPDEVRRYMDDIMDNVTRAEYVLLAMRLPKDNDRSTSEDAPKETTQKDNRVLWATTNPTAAPKLQAIERAPTEEEQYQKFIATVS